MRELFTLLALNPGGLATEQTVRHMWPDRADDPDQTDDVRNTLKTRLTDLRRALGVGDTLAGRHHLPVTPSHGHGRIRLLDIDIDAHHLLTHLDTARTTTNPAEQIAALTAALELIDGEIGAGEISTYPWSTCTINHLHVQVADAAITLGELALTAGNPRLADWATSQARLANPYDQRPMRLALTARTALGDRLGLQRLHLEYLDAFDDDIDPTLDTAFRTALAR